MFVRVTVSSLCRFKAVCFTCRRHSCSTTETEVPCGRERLIHHCTDRSCLLPPTNEVCEGNVFTGVCLSTGGGMHGRKGVWRGGAYVAWGAYVAGGHAWQGACVVAGGVCMAGETATAAGGTHPTGIHSCFVHMLHFGGWKTFSGAS